MNHTKEIEEKVNKAYNLLFDIRDILKYSL